MEIINTILAIIGAIVLFAIVVSVISGGSSSSSPTADSRCRGGHDF